MTKNGMNAERNAVWGEDYDWRTDKIYKCPCCPECEEQIRKGDDKIYRCYSCGNVVSVTDKEMTDWFAVREAIKVEYRDCHKLLADDIMSGCGGKNCVKIHYRRNPVTLRWEFVWSKCEKCGLISMA